MADAQRFRAILEGAAFEAAAEVEGVANGGESAAEVGFEGFDGPDGAGGEQAGENRTLDGTGCAEEIPDRGGFHLRVAIQGREKRGLTSKTA